MGNSYFKTPSDHRDHITMSRLNWNLIGTDSERSTEHGDDVAFETAEEPAHRPIYRKKLTKNQTDTQEKDKTDGEETESGCEHSPRDRLRNTEAEARFYRKIALCFTFADVVLIVCLIAVCSVNQSGKVSGGDRADDDSDNNNAEDGELLEDSSFCLPCEEVYLNDLEVKQNRFKVQVRHDEETNIDVCCEEPHSDLKYFVQTMYMRVNYQQDKAQSQISVTNGSSGTNENCTQDASLHLVFTVDDPTKFNETQPGQFSIPLTKRDASAHDSGSIAIENAVVKIGQRAHYYVYSQVPFRLISPDPASNLTQFVYRIRKGEEDVLLQNSVLPCQIVEESSLQSFAGGLFLLEKGDALSLRVSDPEAVDKTREFQFGVQRI